MILRSATAIILAFILVNFAGCKKNDGGASPFPTPTVLLQFLAQPSYVTSLTDDYIIVSDVNGEVIDFKPFESGVVVGFDTESALPETISVTILQHKHTDKDVFFISTYFEVASGRLWTVANPSSDFTTVGGFKTEVDGFGDYDQLTVSSDVGNPSSSEGGGDYAIVTVPLYDGHKNFYVTASNKAGDIKYQKLLGVHDNQNFVFAFDKMDDYDRTATINFPLCNAMDLEIFGREPLQSKLESGYLLIKHHTPFAGTSIKGAYPTWLDNFTTNLSLTYDSYKYVYTNVGGIPGNIDWPLPESFHFTDKSIGSFESSADVPFLSRTGLWSFENAASIVSWKIYSPSSSQKFVSLPQSLITLYPDLAVQNMVYKNAAFKVHGESYPDFIKGMFETSQSAKVIETVSIELD